MAATWRLGTASRVLATAWTMAGRVAEAQLALLPPDSRATGIMAPELDLFLIEHGGLAVGPRQASLIRARIGSMPRSEQGPCGA